MSPPVRFQRSVTTTPTSASSVRSSGRLIPITLDGSPSLLVTNQPPSPSRVKPPATCRGSSDATYASSSAALGRPKCTVVTACPAATWRTAPSASRSTACPVNSCPDRPAMLFQRRRAASTVSGLPTSSPSTDSIESQPSTTASDTAEAIRSATAPALAQASAVTTLAGEAPPRVASTASSSTSDTSTSGSSPAPRSTPSRPCEAEARMIRTTRQPNVLIQERIAHRQVAEPPAVLEVFGQQQVGAGEQRRLHDQCVPEADLVTLVQKRRRQDQLRVRLHHCPLGVVGDDLPRFGGAHRRPQLAGRDVVELLQDLGADRAGALRPEFGQQGDRRRGLLPIGGVMRVHQNVRIDEDGHELNRRSRSS